MESSKSKNTVKTDVSDLSYKKEFAKSDKNIMQMDAIHEMAISGESLVAVFEHVPNKYSVSDENLRNVDVMTLNWSRYKTRSWRTPSR